MARRNDHTRDELKENILRAALDSVSTHGLSGFNARTIAKKIGYTPGTLYHVYDSLEDIALHINAQTIDMLIAEMSAKRDKGIEALAESYLLLATKHPARWSILASQLTNHPQPAWYQKKINDSFKAIEELLTPKLGKKSKEAARVLWASIHGIALLSEQGKLKSAGIGSSKSLMRSLLTHYISGLKHSR